MQLKPFLLDAWLDQYEHDIEFNRIRQAKPHCQLQIASGPCGGSEFWKSLDG
jgi:hypothetical protein